MATWFEEQIKQRKLNDDEVMARSIVDMAGIVMGNKARAALNDSLEHARHAIDLVFRFYGVRIKEFPAEFNDLDRDLDKLMHPFGLMKRDVILTKGWYKNATGPMLGFLEENGTPVALIPGPTSGYVYRDLNTGRDTVIGKFNEGLFSREAICFYKPFPLKKLGTVDVIRYILEALTPSDIVYMAVATFFATLAGMVSARITYWLFSDSLVLSDSYNSLFAIGIFMVAVSISTIIFNSLKSLILARIQRKAIISVDAAAMMRILSLPSDFFKQYSSGEISQRMSYITSLSNTLSSMLVSTGLTSLFSLSYLTQIFNFAPGLVVPALMIILINVLFSVFSSFMQIGISRERMEKTAYESGLTYSLISGIQKIKLSGAEKRAFGKWSKGYAGVASLMYDPPVFIKINSVISTAINLFGILIMYYFALAEGLSVAEYTAFNVSYGMLTGAFSSLFGIAIDVAGIKPYLKMVDPIFSTLPEISGNKTIVEKLSGAIELSHVSFRYSEDSPMIIDDLSLKIKSGQYVAVVGKTGCGKSTLLRLLIGFETPLKGSVYYDGKDMKSLDLQSLRRLTGTVLQNGKLMSGSIFENICVSDPSLSMDDAWKAAEMAGLAEDIRMMPMGMHTMIAEGSGGISGGQKQRLMIARAVAARPKVLLFDEATSALDNKTQMKVTEALDGLNCTRIVIAHRLSTIKNADRILVLNKGKIIEDGKYDELISAGGFFAELVDRQRLDTD